MYFHNPKYSRQPQLPLHEIATSTVNTLPLMTELFPHIKVHFDDDAFPIHWLAKADGHQTAEQQDVPDTIQEYVQAQREQRDTQPSTQGNGSFAWLICCSSVFLMDLERKIIWASPDGSLGPLVALFWQENAQAAAGEEDLQQKKRGAAEMMSTAYGHVALR